MILGSSSFTLVLPIMIAFLIDQIYQQDNGTITTEEFKQRQVIFIAVIGGINIFSSLCRGCQKKILHDNSQSMAASMRYDLYYNYQVKVHEFKKLETLDVKKSQENFKMGEIDEDIKVLTENVEEIRPMKVQSKLCALTCLVMMFYIAWKYTLTVLALFIVVQLFTNITNGKIETRDEKLTQRVKLLNVKSQNSIGTHLSVA